MEAAVDGAGAWAAAAVTDLVAVRLLDREVSETLRVDSDRLPYNNT